MMLNDSHGMMNGGQWWMTMWMVIWLLIVVAALAIAVFGIVRFLRPRESHDDALELLRRRYAAGEIDQDEYASRRAELGKST